MRSIAGRFAGRRLRDLALGAAVAVAALGSSRAPAAFTTYSDRAVFLGATGATAATGPLPAGFTPTVGSVTFTHATGALMYFEDFSPRLAGNELGMDSLEGVNMTLSGPVYSLGFDFVEPQFDPNVNAPFVDSTFQVTLRSGGVAIHSFTFEAPNDVAWFVGVAGDTLFDRVEVREIVGSIENEFYGQVYTGTTAVPEPSGLALTGLGLAALLLQRRRRRPAAMAAAPQG